MLSPSLVHLETFLPAFATISEILMPLPVPTFEGSDERALCERCAAGDRDAQRAFIRLSRGQVHRTLYRVLGANWQMEDLIQETYVEALRAVGSFRGESSLNTWIDTIAARVVYRHLARRTPRHVPLPVDEEEQGAGDLERERHAREALRRLYVLLDGIEPNYRIAYTLHVVDGRPIKEVARVTRVSTLAVKNRVWRARKMIHERAQRDPLLCEFLPRLRGQS
jgi:RNA polymerase sigma-70 factor (ECF subfamily)